MTIVQLLNQLVQELQGSTLFSPFLLSLLFLSIFVLFSLSRSGDEKLKLPPSPTRLPIIGNLHQLGTLPHRSLQGLSNKYGPLMLLHLGQVPTLVVSSAEMAKEVLKTHDTVFCSRPQSTAAHILLYGCQDIVFAAYGEHWRQVRKICVAELLSVKKVKYFQYAMEDEVEELVNRISKACTGESPVNLCQMLTTTFSNVMSRCIFGVKFANDGGWYEETTRRFMEGLMSFSFGDSFPSLTWMDTLTGFIASLKAIAAEFDGFFDNWIEKSKKGHKEGEAADNKDLFVDMLLQLQNDAILNNVELTQSKLKAIIQDMFLAGSDTTSSTVEWLMAELGRNPSVMKKVQDEIRGVVGKKARVDVNDITKMHYLRCVIQEALRLHPVAPLLVPRETIEAVELGGYHIPAKTRVFVNAFAIQRDPKLWERPDEFLPERFEGNSSVDSKGDCFQFIPFGGGRRGCPGQAFGVASAEYVIANLLYLFDWKLPSGNAKAEALDMTELSGINVCKKFPLHLHPIPYSP